MDKNTTQQLKKLRKQLREAQQEQRFKAIVAEKPAEPDPHALFLAAMKDVVPLKTTAKFNHPPTSPSPWPKGMRVESPIINHAMSDFWPWDELEAGEQLMHMKPGQKLDTLRKLKRGDWQAEAELDLHGENVDSARAQVAQFLYHCQQRQFRCVRIIHGKGLSSASGIPVLKLKLKNWLAQMPEVLAFAQANPFQGCGGAVLVLLKSAKP
ncbi:MULTISPECIES: Smr/MutS family protein [Deefgea]|uniref:DNA mismatch repair protein MutS n=1 Tax=Deefgea chitinilytica TaxID=570276 RepID=A0ABS2C9M6_9NEIS|nr:MULTISPECIES: Smr/MutS family protein [Deefgea]MBM5570838.1 DNA mismatch repair protein MutS [Deefgea chitinilytica]MBM9888067.1 Smr/MutS family protein [Deefgea sp. CFH1-16]